MPPSLREAGAPSLRLTIRASPSGRGSEWVAARRQETLCERTNGMRVGTGATRGYLLARVLASISTRGLR